MRRRPDYAEYKAAERDLGTDEDGGAVAIALRELRTVTFSTDETRQIDEAVATGDFRKVKHMIARRVLYESLKDVLLSADMESKRVEQERYAVELDELVKVDKDGDLEPRHELMADSEAADYRSIEDRLEQQETRAERLLLLTPRERAVCALVCEEGYTQREAAIALGLSEGYISQLLSSAKSKLLN